MKKILFSVLIGVLPITTFSKRSIPIEKIIGQQNYVKAYVSYQGQWHTGYIYYEQTQYGTKLTQYRFDTIYLVNGQSLSGNLGGNERFTTLNPNNPLAVKYNFTHYIDLQGVRAYIISN